MKTSEEKEDQKSIKPIIITYEKTKKNIRDLMASIEDTPNIKFEMQNALIDYILKI